MRTSIPFLGASLTVMALAMVALPASAETLREALVKAYNSNPTISTERARLRGTDAGVALARANGLPAVSASSAFTENVVKSSNSFVSPDRSVTAGVNLSVPIYSGGAVRNAVGAADTRVQSGRAYLRSVESDIFTMVVAVYMNVIRDEAVVRLNEQNLKVLQTNLQATRDRFEVGDLTRTDVAQSEARLALADSQLQTARAQLIVSRESYINIVGTPPGDLETPPALPGLPVDPDSAVKVAVENNPSLAAAQRASDAAGFDVKVARAERLPRLSVVTGGNYYNYLGSLGSGTGVAVGQAGKSATAGVQVTVPLYQGGRPAALVRQAQASEGAAIEQVTFVERGIVAQTRSNYASWQSSLRVIEAAESAVSANRLSLEGVRAENSVGTRTILEILNAEQELLNSQVQLVTARRDAYIAGFALLASMGKAEARDLGLDGGALYDPQLHYKAVRSNIFDWGDDGDPAPEATATIATPAQTSVVTRPLDPELQRDIDTMTPTPDR